MSLTSNSLTGLGIRKRSSLQNGNTQSGGFLLESGDAPQHDSKGKGKRRAVDGDSAASGSTGGRSLSGRSSKRRSRMSSRQSYDSPIATSSNDTHENREADSSILPIDAEQIVRMALSLSEGRRMHLGLGRLPSPGTPSPRQAAYSSSPLSSATLSPEHNGGSLRHHLQQQRRVSRNISPSPISGTSEMLGNHFSAATLARAEKARKYIELSTEYRRLLKFLPPLTPRPSFHRHRDSSLPTAGESLDGRPSYDGQKHLESLHRPYNPLQYIRNRKVRARDRQILDGEAAGWDEISRVSAWVDSVEAKSDHPGYYMEDIAMLPEWVETLRDEAAKEKLSPSAAIASQSKPLAYKQHRPKYDWMINPADLLADAYWLEQGSHKAEIEAHRGHKIFHSFSRPENSSKSMPSPRASYETQGDVDHDDIDSPESLVENGRSSRFAPKDYDPDGFSSQRNKGMVSRATRSILRRQRAGSASSSNLSASDAENTGNALGRKRRGLETGENIGPLEKHMKSIMEAESRNQSDDLLSRSSGDHWDLAHSTTTKLRSGENHLIDDRSKTKPNRNSLSGDSGFSPSRPGTPRISVEFYGNNDNAADTLSNQLHNNNDISPSISRRELPPFGRSKPSRLEFLRRGKSKEKNQIDENDFASLERYEFHDQTEASNSNTGPVHSIVDSKEDPATDVRTKFYTRHESERKPMKSELHSSRIFKGGRIGEIVREEKPGLGDFLFKLKAPRDHSRSSSGSRRRFHSSEEDDVNFSPDGKRREVHGDQMPPIQPRRSRSASDLKETKYHFANLPTFVSSNVAASPTPEEQPDYRQQQQQENVESRKSRFDRLATTALGNSDFAMHDQTSDITRGSTATLETSNPIEHVRSYGFPNMSQSSSRSTSGVRSSGKRLNDILAAPGGVGAGGLPKTGLTSVENRRGAMSRPEMGDLRSWSIADGNIAMIVQQPASVTGKELEYVRAMLMSSGVKAWTMVKRANLPQDQVPDFLLRASEVSGLPLPTHPVSRKQEHILAARLLSKSLEDSVADFERAAEIFRGTTCTGLHEKIDEMRYKINTNLTPWVRSCGDDADAFIGRLTTTHTISVTQVNESIDLMMRSRRRRLRMLSKIGFAFLEWLLVGIMWGIWLIVMLVHALKTIIVGLFRVVRWFLWI